MRKVLLAFFISLFFLSGALGFGVVRQVRAITVTDPAPVMAADQVNLILIHVDNLASNRPGLTSIWGVFISRSVFPGLIMKRIFPETASLTSAKLASAFSLDPQKNLDSAFLNLISELDLPKAEFVLVDDQGLSDYVRALSSQIPGDELFQTSQTTDLEVFQKLCSAIETPGNVYPFVTDTVPQIDEKNGIDNSLGFVNKWKGLVTSLHFASCEVLAGP